MEKKINILLISRDDNCVTEVTNFLLQSECIYGFLKKDSLNKTLTTFEYAYRDGPPTVIKGFGLDTSRVYFVLKSFDTIKFDYHIERKNRCRTFYSYDAVIMYTSNESDTELILKFLNSPNYLNCMKTTHSLTIIGELVEQVVQNMNYSSSGMSKWIWNGKIAYSWYGNVLAEGDEKNNLWIHITQSPHGSSRVSYYSEMTLSLNINIVECLVRLLAIIRSNIDLIAKEKEINGNDFSTKDREDYSYTLQYTQLLIQYNVSSLKDFDRLLKEEMKQLKCHLSRLAVLCDEIVNFNEPRKLFTDIGNLPNFETLFLNELRSVNRVNAINVVYQSLDAMSKMNYTGQYIKNVLGFEKIEALKSCLQKHYSFKNIKTNIPANTVDNLLVKAVKQDNRHENRIQKSLQNTVQEFPEEVMRKLLEEFTKITANDNREIKERLYYMEQDNKELREKLSKLEQKPDITSKKSLK